MTPDRREELTALRDRARRFAEGLSQDLEARDLAAVSSREAWAGDWAALAAEGVLGCLIPKEHGGAGLDALGAVAMLEGLGRGCAENGLTLAVNGQIWAVTEPILAFGTPAQKARWLPGLASGDILGAHGMTEAASGSDAFALATRAERAEGPGGVPGYRLNGEKVHVGLAPVCDLALVFASTRPEAGRWGLSAFLVSAEDAGFGRGASQPKMGLRTQPFGTLTLKDCWIPEDRRLGAEGQGAAIFNHSMEWERAFIFASHVGSMARQLADAAAFARARKVFGKPIIEHQSVSNRLADMAVRLETSRLLLYKAAELKSRDEPCPAEAAMAKLHISEAFAANSLDAMRIHGGAGYLSGPPERDVRDALGGVIYSGTSDIQRQIIAALIGDDP